MTAGSDLSTYAAAIAMYARLGRSGRLRESAPPLHRDSLLFIDVDVAAPAELKRALAHLRFLAPVALGHVSTVVIRWPWSAKPDPDLLAEAFDELKWVSGRLRLHSAVGFCWTEHGRVPELLWGPDELAPPASPDPGILATCRAIELSSILLDGRALWRPTSYHYRLPSGRHSGTFVRMADAIRSERDSQVLAWWLLRHLREGAALVIDSSTLVPVTLALRLEALRAGFELGDTATLSSYPATVFDFSRTIRRVAGKEGVLGLLSVSSSGSIRQNFVQGLKDALGARNWTLDTFVDKALDEAFWVPDRMEDMIDNSVVWLGLGDAGERAADACTLCTTQGCSAVVHIDPTSFDGLVLPEPELLMPDIRFADEAREFWELCDRTKAVALDAQAHPAAAHVRPQNSSMGVRIDFDPMFAEQAGDEAVREDLIDFMRARFLHIPSVDLVVAPKSELERADGSVRTLVEGAFAEIAPAASVIGFDLHGPAPAEATSAIVSAQHLALFTLGVVSGTTLHRLLAAVSDIRRAAGRPAGRLDVFVLHARPSSERMFNTIANPFGRASFHVAAMSYLPDATEPSPLRQEADLLRSLSAARYRPAAVQFLRRRLEVLRSSEVSSELLWGMESAPEPAKRLRPGSLYGETLTAITAFVSVGSAVHRRRGSGSRGGAPEWRQFEVPAITRSYFDPLIVCSILRWLRPEECWWGRESSDSAKVMHEFLAGYGEDHELRIVTAEFLLAAALGKVPRAAVNVLADVAKALIEADEDRGGALQLGLDVAL